MSTSATSPEVVLQTGDDWAIDDDSLTVYDAEGKTLADFAKGHWAYCILVD